MIGFRTVLPVLGAAGAYAALVRPRLLSWGATSEEANRVYPGDELIPEATGQSTMAVTLPAPPERVWPWLVQMGHDRGGWYSWDRLDNTGHPSAERIVPEWQGVKVGDRMITMPNGTSWFTVAMLDEPRTLVLRADLQVPTGRPFDPRGTYPSAYTEGVWAFHLQPVEDGQTRLVVRTRGRGKPRIPERVAGIVLGEPAHFIMQVRQFQNLRRRLQTEPAEADRPRVTAGSGD
ncbi:SRPBCC family protein [Actinomadura rudentiformis]|uniref:SRPBCC family protein n=1 Tax=Actinomadura rudentiformis TaxID=359158 RepID=UPI00178C6E2A|nr:SRPBCC family protein [Actinomadura rudentiformis]